MSAWVFTAYATRYGSTQEVAENIAAMLREAGLEVNLQPMRNVRTIEGHRVVVPGPPIYVFAGTRTRIHDCLLTAV